MKSSTTLSERSIGFFGLHGDVSEKSFQPRGYDPKSALHANFGGPRTKTLVCNPKTMPACKVECPLKISQILNIDVVWKLLKFHVNQTTCSPDIDGGSWPFVFAVRRCRTLLPYVVAVHCCHTLFDTVRHGSAEL